MDNQEYANEMYQKVKNSLASKGFELTSLTCELKKDNLTREFTINYHKNEKCIKQSYNFQSMDEIAKDIADHADYLDRKGS